MALRNLNSGDPGEPGSFARRALLCVVGLSPQVVTETLYALAVTQSPPFVPTELHIVTTSLGAGLVRARLLDEGVLQDLAGQYLSPGGLRFDADRHLHVIHRGGRALSDIETVDDNAAVADTILQVLRPLVRDPLCAVHASIAGGRKSMGFYMGYVLSLLGRPQDRLSHVLVNAELESHRDFYFPPMQPRTLTLANGTRFSTSRARITLAPVGFVRMTEGLDQQLLREHLNFNQLIARAQQALTAVQVTLVPARREVRVAEAAVVLAPVLMAWYLFFALRRQRQLREDDRLVAAGMVRIDANRSRWLGLNQDLLNTAFDRVQITRQDLSAVSVTDIRPHISKINAALRSGLGAELAVRVGITGPSRRRADVGQYGLLGLQAEHIHVG